MMFWYGNNMNGWGYAGMGIGMVLFWALIIVGIVALVRFSSGNQQGGQPPTNDAPSPEQLLAGRFARGEIDETQYRERLAVLRDHIRL
ncbi:SHOCT domain-containing protein [Mycobacterium sp.]|jgi:putative membrane protein|uniref:SHOCT domain-containing protein n=1 Tax=Mycobacterium sp. TaxID=1785 RepID=UPI00333E915B|nr:putative rane protein [Mycobacterium sp.]